MSGQLTALATLDALHPPGTVLATRTLATHYAWVTLAADSVDTVPGLPLAIAGGLPLLGHVSATGPAARRLFAAAGLAFPTALEPYATEAEARAILARWIAEGRRLATIYPLPADWAPPQALLVEPGLMARLNSKAHLAALVPEALRPRREIVPRARLCEVADALPGEAVLLKVATDIGNGAGRDLWVCADAAARAEAIARLAAETRPFEAVVVERREDFAAVWCAGFAVLDEQVRWLGASRQRLTAEGLQAGNILGSGPSLPPEGRAAVEALAHAAGRLGYRGVAGCDLGLTRDGRLLIFDLNFRLNASTAMLLLQPAAAARGGLPVAINAHVAAPLEPEDFARRLQPWVEAGRLVATRVLDHRLLPSRTAQCSATGFLLGEDEADCLALEARIVAALA